MDIDLYQHAIQSYGYTDNLQCCPDFTRYANQVMEENNLSMPKDHHEGLNLYFVLTQDAENMISTIDNELSGDNES